MKLKHEFPPEFFEESTATFRIDRDRKRLWAALLDLLAEFDRVCRKHNLTYSIDGGTMLGKARHNGIIPWDDDIDVIMMRADYEKLKAVAAEEFKAPYFLQTMESDPEACRGHPMLRNGSTTMILKSEFKDGKALWKTFNQGVCMDVFVLDAIPDNEGERVRYFEELCRLKNCMLAARWWRHVKFDIGFTPRQFLNLIRTIRCKWYQWKTRKLCGIDPLIYFQQEFEKACRRYEGVETKDVSHVQFEPSPTPSRVFERSHLCEVEDVDFMGLNVMMLKDWKYYLKNLYGDWHKHVIGATCHGGLFIDLDNPYTRYF